MADMNNQVLGFVAKLFMEETMNRFDQKPMSKVVCMPRDRYYSYVLSTIIEEKKRAVFENLKRNRKSSSEKIRIYKFISFR